MEQFILCPNCGEANPKIAILCWACYTPLVENSADSSVSDANDVNFVRVGAILFEYRPKKLASLIKYVGLASLLISPLSPRRLKGWSIGVGLAALAALAFKGAWSNTERPKQTHPLDELEPSARILNTIILYAIRDSANRIQLRKLTSCVTVSYEIGNDWVEQMKIPGYVWPELIGEIAKRGLSQEGHWNGDELLTRDGSRLPADVPSITKSFKIQPESASPGLDDLVWKIIPVEN